VGLLQIKERFQQLQTRTEADVTNMEVRHRQLQEMEKTIIEFEESRTSALAGECFKSRKHANYKCRPNGPAVTAYEYLLCRYEQNHHLDNKGVFRRGQDSTTSAEALSARNKLETVLANIFGDMPDQKNLPQ